MRLNEYKQLKTYINMKTKEVKQQKAADEPYVAPAIEIIDIELTQNILESSGDGVLPGVGDGGLAW